MTYLDEYQWRYRRPAPSLHEVFAEMTAGCWERWRRRRQARRAIVAIGLLLLGLAVAAASGRAAHAGRSPLAVAAEPLSSSQAGRVCRRSPLYAQALAAEFAHAVGRPATGGSTIGDGTKE